MSATAKPKEKGQLVRIKFNERESGWARQLSKGKVRLMNIPVFDDQWLIDDVVTLKKVGIWDHADRLVKRVFAGKAFLYYDEEWEFHMLCGALRYLGCKVEGMISSGPGCRGMMAAVFPRGVDPKKVAEKLCITQKGLCGNKHKPS